MTPFYENIRQHLIEKMADFLDKVEPDEKIEGVSDPFPREQSELHIRMAEAAFNEYLKTMKK